MTVTGHTVVGDGGVFLLSFVRPLGFFSCCGGSAIGTMGPPIAISTALGAEHLGVSCLGSVRSMGSVDRSIRSISSPRSLMAKLKSRGEIVGSIRGGELLGSEMERPFRIVRA